MKKSEWSCVTYGSQTVRFLQWGGGEMWISDNNQWFSKTDELEVGWICRSIRVFNNQKINKDFKEIAWAVKWKNPE